MLQLYLDAGVAILIHYCCGDAKGVSKNNSDTLKGKGVLIEERGGRVRGGGGEVGEKLLWQSIQPA